MQKIQAKYFFQGIPISIENKKGSVRQGVDQDGNEWKNKMLADYGYIRLTEGVDGDHLDVYVGENPRADAVYIFHMNNPQTGKYDEDKVFLGFDTDEQVEDMLKKQYDNPAFVSGNMTMLTISQFKTAIAKKQNRGKPITFCAKDVKKSLDSFSTEIQLHCADENGKCPVCGNQIVNKSESELIIKSRLAKITPDGVFQKCKNCGNFVNVSELVKAFLLFKLFDKSVKMSVNSKFNID